jgi:hypothetical protein
MGPCIRVPYEDIEGTFEIHLSPCDGSGTKYEQYGMADVRYSARGTVHEITS